MPSIFLMDQPWFYPKPLLDPRHLDLYVWRRYPASMDRKGGDSRFELLRCFCPRAAGTMFLSFFVQFCWWNKKDDTFLVHMMSLASMQKRGITILTCSDLSESNVLKETFKSWKCMMLSNGHHWEKLRKQVAEKVFVNLDQGYSMGRAPFME